MKKLEENNRILELLDEINSDTSKAVEFLDFDFKDIFDVAIKNRRFDELLKLVKPLEVNGKKIIAFDAFNENMEGLLRDMDVNDEKSTITEKERKNLIFQMFNISYDEMNDMKISDIHARKYEQTALPIFSSTDVLRYVEFPLVRSAMEFAFLNIPTVDNDVEGVFEDDYVSNGNARLVIDYSALSDDNKEVADELIEKGCADRYDDNISSYVSLCVPCSSDDKVSEVSDRMMKLTNGFTLQKIDSRYKVSPFIESYQYIKNR